MKNTLTIGLLCLALGVGAGWLLKPGTNDEDSSATEPEKKAPARPASKSERGPVAGPPTKSDREGSSPRVAAGDEEADPDREEVREEMRRRGDRFREMVANRQKARHDQRIQELVNRLGLSDEQADRLRAYFEKNRADLAAMTEGDEDWTRIKELTGKLRGEGLDDALAEILTDDQKAAYEEMKALDRQNEIEARAFKDLANIQRVLHLTPEQKDQVYQILHEDAANSLDENRDANAIVSTFTEGLGINVDPQDLGIAGAIQVQIEKAASGEDPGANAAEVMQAVQENRQRNIDEKVARLAPVLDDQQEESYRTHLEGQGAGLLGGLLGRGMSFQREAEIPAEDGGE